jgi:uncharacterized membrane protein YgaE (UPF0421/DUF939 family)
MPDTPIRVRERFFGGAAQGLMSAVAALLAYLPTRPLGLQEGFWGSLTAIAVIQGDFRATTSSARDQFIGAAIGGVVGAFIDTWVGQSLAAYCAAVLIAMTICWLFKVPSAARLSGTTATILVLVPHHSTTESMMLSRICEVGWGISVSIGLVWLTNTLKPRFDHSA